MATAMITTIANTTTNGEPPPPPPEDFGSAAADTFSIMGASAVVVVERAERSAAAPAIVVVTLLLPAVDEDAPAPDVVGTVVPLLFGEGVPCATGGAACGLVGGVGGGSAGFACAGEMRGNASAPKAHASIMPALGWVAVAPRSLYVHLASPGWAS